MKRLWVCIISGAVLGIICVIGGTLRAGGFSGNEFYIVGMWYNRVIMGLVIGLAGSLRLTGEPANRYLRGALLGLLVSLAFFLSTGLRDPMAFFAGIVYGLIIEFVAQRLA
ncbi:MAG: hypothetical protein JXA37_13760 [Chloroflexia bacterium]|nr:hypothetical protein [Chloroflexia bacterium]